MIINVNGNRNYKYIKGSKSKRPEYEVVARWVENGSKIIDLGSGDGSLLKLLKDTKRTRGIGIEISASGVEAARKNGIKSIKGRIDVKLPFKNRQFDYAICNVTLQMVKYPEILLAEMIRIAKNQIITFPNFAFIINRLELLISGKTPTWSLFGYKWYSAGQIHQLSIRDFKEFCDGNDIKIIDQSHVYPGSSVPFLKKFAFNGYILKVNPNLFACMGVFLTTADFKKGENS